MNASIAQFGMKFASSCSSTCVVVLVSIGQLNTSCFSGWLLVLNIIMSTIEKCAHNFRVQIATQVPVPWLGSKCALLGIKVNVL